MTLPVTLALLILSVGFVVFAGWRGALPPDLARGPRMVPWRFLMILSAALAFFLLIHVAALLGAPMRSPLA